MPRYRVAREPIVTLIAASAGRPATAGAYIWRLSSMVYGEVHFLKEDIEEGRLRVKTGKRVGENDLVVVYDQYTVSGVFGGVNGVIGVSWEEKVFVPPREAVPARDASTVITGRIGWDGGGRSRPQVAGGQRVIFEITRAGAVLAGLARPGSTYSFAAPRAAWYRHGNALECTLSGAVVFTLDPDISDAAIAGWRFALERTGAQIQWLYATGPEEPYTVAFAAPDPGGQLVAIGMPYTIGDSIDALEIVDVGGTLEVTLPAVRGRLSDTGWSALVGVLPPMIAELISEQTGSLEVTLPPVAGRLGETGWARIAGRLPALAANLRSEPTFSLNTLWGAMLPLTASLRGFAVLVGGIDGQLPPMLGRLEEDIHGRIAGSLPAMTGFLSDYNRDSGMDFLSVGFAHALENPLLLITIDGIEVGDTSTISVYMDLLTADGLLIADNATIGALLDVLVQEGIAIGDGGALSRREALQYAVNLVTGAPSVYSGFDFHGFVQADGIAYGWRSDGLYRIGDDTGSDEILTALVDFGISDFGSARRKRVPTCWLGIRTDGDTYIRVQADDGAQYVYRTRASEDNHKAVLGKGIAGRQWSVTLELTDATFASLDSLEIEIAVLPRRFGGK